VGDNYIGYLLSFHSVVTLNYFELNFLLPLSIIAEKLQMDWWTRGNYQDHMGIKSYGSTN